MCKFKLMLMTLALALMAGCGGGGGGGGGGGSESGATGGGGSNSGDVVGDSRVNATVSSQESTTSFTPIDGEIQSIDFVTGEPGIRLTRSGQGVQVEVPELKNDVSSRFKVVSVKDGETLTTFITVTAQNTSAEPLLSRLNALGIQALEQSSVQDDVRLTRILMELEYLAGNYTITDRNRFLEEYLEDFNAALASFTANVSGLSSVATNYREGAANEDDLERVLTDAETRLSDLSIAGEQVFDDLRDVLVALGVVLPGDPGQSLPLTYDSNQGRYTRFTNASLGAYENGQWVFSPEFDFLNAALLLSTSNASNGSN